MRSDYTVLHIPKTPHLVHNLPDCDVLDTVIRCNDCAGVFVLRLTVLEGHHHWVPLRWWHRTARRALRNERIGNERIVGHGPYIPHVQQIDQKAQRLAAAKAAHPAGRRDTLAPR